MQPTTLNETTNEIMNMLRTTYPISIVSYSNTYLGDKSFFFTTKHVVIIVGILDRYLKSI